MKTGTYKLYRVKNHYHIHGERCNHTGRTPHASKRISAPKLVGIALMIWLVLALLSVPLHAQTILTYQAGSTPALPIEVKTETLMEQIDRIADQYKIERSEFHKIVKCESSYNPKAKNISNVERSFGLSQINTMVHDVTPEEAMQPEVALNFLGKNWEKRYQMWYHCSRK